MQGVSTGDITKDDLRLEEDAYLYAQELPLTLGRGTIVDLETTDLVPSKAAVVCLGAIHGNRLEVRVRPREVRATKFYDAMRRVVQALPRPVFAYNTAFDGKFLKRYLGYEKTGLVADIFEPWRSRAEAAAMKWPSLDELIRGPWDDIPRDLKEDLDGGVEVPLGALREEEEAWLKRGRQYRIPPRVRRVTGKEIPRLWREYLAKGDPRALADIVAHNRQDLLKTLCLFLFLG